MDHQHYSVYDLVKNDSFCQWVKNGKNDQKWREWLAQHPESKKVIEEARQIVLLIEVDTHNLSNEDIDTLRQKIDEQIADTEQIFRKKEIDLIQNNKQRRLVPAYGMAATVALLIVAMVALWMVVAPFSNREYITGYGEQKTVFLPDSSKVTLNANSKITLEDKWDKNKREVWLKGEAYFEVEKKALPANQGTSKFIVHANEVGVEVVGTAFNVKSRHGNTQVVLNEGKVQLHLPEAMASGKNETLTMKPGEMVEYAGNSKQLTQKIVDAKRYSAWRLNQLVFDQTTLKEIGQTLEDLYGKEVVIRGEELANRTFSGTIPNDSLGFVLKALSESFYINIQTNKNTIIMEENKDPMNNKN